MKRPKINPLVFAFLIPVVVIIAALALVISRRSAGSDVPPLPSETFTENPATLRGNVYSLNCIIDRQLAQNEKGRILAVRHWEKQGRLAVYVPASLNQNFEIGQRYTMTVRVQDNALYVESLQKF
ncbi:MAG: hypothetical protein IKW49_05360 [Opitutales bacterium]|nr:hypothetical protein [Opitutales bacterium]